MERRCDECPMRASCVEICPEVAAQLPKETLTREFYQRPEEAPRLYAEFIDQKEHIAALRSFADCLTAEQRAAFDAYYNEGLSHQAIGERLGISSSAVAKRLVSARTRITREAFLRVEGKRNGKG